MRSLLLAVVLVSGPGLASEPTIFDADPGACMEGPLAQFGRYIGDWKIEDEQLARDGSGWGPGKGARWIFECVGKGTAVQDFWFSGGGGFGTNLRTYNAETETWEIVWAAKQVTGLMQIRARMDDEDKIVMEILAPDQDPPRRIIFYEPHEGGWNWVQEWTFDDGKSWQAVYRIKATPWRAAGEAPSEGDSGSGPR